MRSKQICACVLAVAAMAYSGASRALADQTSWTGMISDSQCRGDHGGEVDPTECTLKCIRSGDTFILATENGVKIVPIANQDFPALRENAGRTVKVTGELQNGAIVISKIALP